MGCAQSFADFVTRVEAAPDSARTALIDRFMQAIPQFPFRETASGYRPSRPGTPWPCLALNGSTPSSCSIAKLPRYRIGLHAPWELWGLIDRRTGILSR
ncbi:MAG: hypothetical protein Q9P14_04455 [candidate division KSB1 bacterium]|nr:hypothetical protein [candidate division KSB1 bacterium]